MYRSCQWALRRYHSAASIALQIPETKLQLRLPRAKRLSVSLRPLRARSLALMLVLPIKESLVDFCSRSSLWTTGPRALHWQ